MARADVKLQCTTADNHNKVYLMHDLGNGWFVATWGRVGGHMSTKEYPIDKWDAKYRAECKKGYTDITDTTRKVCEYKESFDLSVNELLKNLLSCSRQYVSKFTDSGVISDSAAKEAQELINKMVKDSEVENPTQSTIDSFNEYLIRLFTIIPRKIKNTRDAIAKSTSDFQSIISSEQTLLDNLITLSKTAPETSGEMTIEEAFGFTIRPATDEEFEAIKTKLTKDGGVSRYKLSRVFVVDNPKRDVKFEEYLTTHELKRNKTNVKQYWHGSGTENILSILANGIMIKPANAAFCGSAYGVGAYHAPQPDKACGYTSGGGWRGGSSNKVYMFVNDVIMGKQFDVKDNYETYDGIRIHNLTQDRFEASKLGYHSVYAHSGGYLRRDEAIVYNMYQVACRYLCEFVY